MKSGTQSLLSQSTLDNLLQKIESWKLVDTPPHEIAKHYQNAINPTVPNVDEAVRLIELIREHHSTINIPKPPIKYPVFQGGGAKGGVYIGAYEVLDKNGYLDEIVCPAGTSAGGIPAFFMGLGFDSEQFKYLSEHMNFTDFLDVKKNGWGEFFSGAKIGTALDVLRYGAASPGKSFHQWASFFVEQVLGDKDATFRDLHEKMASDPTLKEMLFISTHYGTPHSLQAQQVFSFENTPDVVIADAFRATISFPGAFEPWQVRQKEFIYETGADGKQIQSLDIHGNPQFVFKSLGYFADGGILNNFPVNAFNSQYYSDSHYQMLERKDEHHLPVQVNPCVVGFSITPIEELNEAITPLPSRIKAILPTTTGLSASSSTVDSHWHFRDLAKAVFWNTIGKPEVEDVAQKQSLYFDQTVQIWPDAVTTLEFDISAEKLGRLIQNGNDATKLWLHKFKDARDHYPHTYDDRLTQKEERLKRTNPQSFYFCKLQDLFWAFSKELKKQQSQQNTSDEAILGNTHLGYLSNQILECIAAANDDGIDVTHSAFVNACEAHQQHIDIVENNRAKRWNMILPDTLIDNICDKLNKEPLIALKMLKSQLSNLIWLSSQNNGQLLHAIINTNDARFVDKALRMITKTINQAYYHGKVTDVQQKLKEILSQTAPSLYRNALLNHNHDIIQILLKHGVPIALDEAIAIGDYDAFKLMLTAVVNNDVSLSSLVINKIDLWQTIFKNAPNEFVHSFCDDRELLLEIINTKNDSSGKNVLHYLAQRGNATGFCAVAYEILTSPELPKGLLTALDVRGNSPLSYIIKHNRGDILHALINQGKGKKRGIFKNGDYSFDQIFDWKDPTMANNADYRDLIQAFSKTPKLYRYIMDHFSNKDKALAINNRVVRENKFAASSLTDVLDFTVIKQEPIIFRKYNKNPHHSKRLDIDSTPNNTVLTKRAA
ncbi:patatin-like phospholipase family protein [Candidatus Berkiella aquae]|uniref:Patatin-like phospholipase n=1 Tax=Candidatus Berkiella aquae TaxID=295108 RepID=A0A0Q9YVR8_9GAMM|nr:patatin-like phospholipase family protein [Candidatus Berkiella aquae]MCS5711524.1 patatin-like phospholipase family protein [Candidatus Berkiella aquae]